jgi:choline monooxygenase
MSDFEPSIDERIAFAATLPSRAYFDPDILAAEKRRVFGRTWNLVGHLNQVTRPGDFFTSTIGDEPLVVARGIDQTLRAFSNVCRHRAGPVASGAGNRKSLQCGYHGWTYALDGKLLTTPEFDGVECFNKDEICLPAFKVDQWSSLIFANLDRMAPTLADVLGDLPARIKHRDLSQMKLAARSEWQVSCNWKVYVDNYLEGYHIPIVHPGLNRELDYANYRVETARYYSIQHSPIRRREGQRINLTGTPADYDAQYFWLFPNLMLNVYPDNYSTNLILPLGPETTLTVFEWFTLEPGSDEAKTALEKTIEFSDEVQREDIAICEAVHRGLRSATYERGRYSVKRENGVHHFHRLLDEFWARAD